jgi:hypothetical protein
MNIKKQYEKLKMDLFKIGIIAPGRLRTTYLRCGKSNCKCQRAKKQSDKHGPYVFWDRKIDDKLSSMSLKTLEAREIQKWIQNRKKFDQVVEKMKRLGQEIAVMTKSAKLKSG